MAIKRIIKKVLMFIGSCLWYLLVFILCVLVWLIDSVSSLFKGKKKKNENMYFHDNY